ncbi:MAG: undecaprenyl-phosphate galactose phosphotransferase WbaP [Leptolyngbya sp. SIO1E4]|nr:undecaprenyl-phosphate galactose phosphotransferase WbaP [Leptolyngbya sp. SIO1E4]
MTPLSQILRPASAPLTFSLRLLSTSAPLVVADALGLILAGIISVHVRLALGGQFEPELYWQLWPLLGIMLLIYGVANLYPAVGLSPVEELRRLCLSTTLFYMALGAVIFLTREGTTYSRGIFLMAWLLSMGGSWLSRVGIRKIFSRCTWWGFPVLIMGAGKTGELVIRTLKRQPSLGLKPVAVLDDDPQKQGTLEAVPVLGQLSLTPYIAQELNVSYAIVAMPGVPREKLLAILERYGKTFPHLLVIPDLFGFASLWVSATDMGGILGLEIRQRLLLPGPRLIKTALDWLLTVIVGLLALPLFGIIIIAVKLDSPGPIFYGQYRLGRGARPFIAWKFRTMVMDADWVLDQHLAQNVTLREQWEKTRKLKQDPRITRIGRILRRTSLDELPQLWNVMRGEMSLVGPRPIVDDEIVHYADKFELYKRVLPGITGLWQVSGRSDVTYSERVTLDAYYVRNWSVWLDIYILLKTIWVVLVGDGAY